METGNSYLCDWTQNCAPAESVQPWSFLILAQMKVNSQLHDPAPLTPEKESPVPIK
jgi:hypothetical protein